MVSWPRAFAHRDLVVPVSSDVPPQGTTIRPLLRGVPCRVSLKLPTPGSVSCQLFYTQEPACHLFPGACTYVSRKVTTFSL